jgi:DNA-directed RNA polymerase subunit beta'
MPSSGLEQVIYYNAFVITTVDEDKKAEFQKNIELAYKAKLKNASNDEKSEITKNYKQTLLELKLLRVRQILNEKDYFSLIKKYNDVFEADTGSEPILKFLKEIDLEKEKEQVEENNKKKNISQLPRNLKRLKIIKSFIKSGVKPEWVFVKNLPVLPPDLRPMVPLDGGRYASSDLNDLYRRIITRNNRLKKLLNINAPLVIVKNEKRMLQEAVDSLFDSSLRKTKAIQKSQKRPYRSLADVLKGKQGRFRQNLLGKRVDYSGRSVIVVGPKLKMSECGLPKNIALELFRPFIINKLLEREIAYSTVTANRLIDDKTDEV